jgi:hypothetical protein
MAAWQPLGLAWGSQQRLVSNPPRAASASVFVRPCSGLLSRPASCAECEQNRLLAVCFGLPGVNKV